MRTFIFFIGLIVFNFNLYGQDSNLPSNPTTAEEYNYLTKGYKIQLESGLDMKRGYSLTDFGEVNDGNYLFTFKILVRDKENEMAAILVIIKSHVSGNTYYLCIPQGNKELMKQYFESFSTFDNAISKAYIRVLSEYFSRLTLVGFEMDKQ